MKYRRDIDGLRSLAILPVVWYHAGLPGLPAGFAGVDVFFVISGFLITSILYDEYTRTGRIDFLNFYQRRARRILPALFFTLALTFVSGAFVLDALDFKDLQNQALSALFFVSNIFFNQTIEYFSQQAELMLLLHTWSLSVEEQFYLVWPAVVFCLGYLLKARMGGKVIFLVGGLISASFLVSWIAVSRLPQAAFYLTPFRLWELGIGGALAVGMAWHKGPALLRGAAFSTVAYGAALLTVGATYVYLDSESAFPGPAVAPLVLATAALLYYGRQPGNRLSKALESPVLVYIGKISYSLYLVHWVVIAAFRNYAGSIELSPAEGVSLAALSVPIASFSYHMIENPFRRRASVPAVWLMAGSGAVAVGVIAFAVLAFEGVPSRIGKALPDYVASRDLMLEWRHTCRVPEGREIWPESKQDNCVFGAPWESATTRWLVWGDSHADHLSPLLERVMPKGASALVYRVCPPFLDHSIVKRWHKGAAQWSRQCGGARERLLEWLGENRGQIDRVILAAAWSGYPQSLYERSPDEIGDVQRGVALMEHAMEATAARIPRKMKVLVLSDVPRPRTALINCVAGQGGILLRRRPKFCEGLPRDYVDAYQQPTTDMLERVAARHANFEMIDIADRMCSDTTCEVFLNGRLLYRDGNHYRMNLNLEDIDALVQRIGLRDVLDDAVLASPSAATGRRPPDGPGGGWPGSSRSSPRRPSGKTGRDTQ